MPKIAIALFLACIVFFVKRRWIIFILFIILDFWFFANILYHRSYGMPIDAYTLAMATNLQGFGDAIFIYIEPKDSIIFALSLFFIPLAYFCKATDTQYIKMGGVILLASYIINLGCITLNYARYTKSNKGTFKMHSLRCYLQPFSFEVRDMTAGTSWEYDYSIIHYIGFNIVDGIELIKARQDTYTFTQTDYEQLKPHLGTQTYENSKKKRFVIVIVESLENWAIQPDITPNFYRLLDSGHSFWATKITSQVSYGCSSDGQLIINTGLLPCFKDAVCYRFPFNTYPTYPKGKSATILPHPINVWNQSAMSVAYQYDTTVVNCKNDVELCENVIKCIDFNYDMVQVITMTSHAPFGAGKSANLDLDNRMPEMMRDYLGCISITDNGFKQLVDKVLLDSLWSDVTLIITGDHTIFPKEKRMAYSQSCVKNQLDYHIENNYCPLIVYSQSIDGNMINNSVGYQMDIFPTILSILGYKDYYWKGLGEDLLHTAKCKDKELSDVTKIEHIVRQNVDSLRILSDKLLRSNYFKNHTIKSN